MEAGQSVSEGSSPAGDIVQAVLDFMEEIRPKGGVIGPPYVHRLGATRGPALTVRCTFPSWDPPRSPWPGPLRVQPAGAAGPQKVPEAFRRR